MYETYPKNKIFTSVKNRSKALKIKIPTMYSQKYAPAVYHPILKDDQQNGDPSSYSILIVVLAVNGNRVTKKITR
jgi:hypothetical protein